MNALDILLVVVIAAAILYGLVRGFVHIALGVAGFGFGLAAALRIAARGPGLFPALAPNTARLAVFALVMLVALVLTAIAVRLGGALVRAAGISWMDRVAGSVIGLGGGMLVTLGLLLALATFLPAGSKVLRESRALPVALGAIDLAATILPPGLAEAYNEQRRQLATAAEPENR